MCLSAVLLSGRLFRPAVRTPTPEYLSGFLPADIRLAENNILLEYHIYKQKGIHGFAGCKKIQDGGSPVFSQNKKRLSRGIFSG